MNKHYAKLKSLGACDPGLEWLANQGDDWYDKFERGD